MASQAPKVDAVSKLMFVLSLVAILLAVYVLLNSLVNTYKRNVTKGEIDTTQQLLAVENNLKPVGLAATADTPVASATGRSGKEVYDGVCASCHATGLLESPKFADKAAWESRIAKGLDELVKTATNGIGAMPAKGGDPSLSETEIKNAIVYLVEEAEIEVAGAEPANTETAPATETAKSEEASAEAEVKEEKTTSAEAATTTAAASVTPETPAAPSAPETPKSEPAPAAAAAPAATAVADSAEGRKVYDSACFACHTTGVAASPILGNKEQWAPRIATGMDALYAAAINGKGAMPPKGGNMALDDAKVKAAVDYMVNQSQ